VLDLASVKKERVSFHLRGLDGMKETFDVSAQMRVKDFIKERLVRIDRIPHFYIGLVYVGKMLSPERTFF
jgi:hypothetical protein